MSHLDDPFTPPPPAESSADATVAADSPAAAAAAEAAAGPDPRPAGPVTRRRTREGRAEVREELARRRAEREAAAPAAPPAAAPEGSPEDLGLPTLIEMPSDGIPEVVEDEAELAAAARALAAGTGPVAVDAERASGYRYGQRAYLVQLRRAGAATVLLDPIACPDLGPIAEVIGDVEWVVHAASQDLPCLAELGLFPAHLFDTELGARLAGQPRVGLAAVLEHYLGVTLAKEHSAVDWSTRPLPEPWLRYAALDVEVLPQLRDAIEADLADQGKLDWAHQEFAALTSFTGPAPRVDPWRRLSGLHKIRSRRTMAVARELWYTRDDVARTRDVSPGRVIPDAALLEIAQAAPGTLSAVGEATGNRAARRYASAWLGAVTAALSLTDEQLPLLSLPSDGPPPPRAWADRDPAAAARLAAVRADLAAFSAQHTVPVENLISPDTLRRVLWSPPEATDEAVRSALAGQIDIVAPAVIAALQTGD